jgi:hypothetical protein
VSDRGALHLAGTDPTGQFTASFDAVLADMGIQVVRIPARCPRANCFTELSVRTLRAELTDRISRFRAPHLPSGAELERFFCGEQEGN